MGCPESQNSSSVLPRAASHLALARLPPSEGRHAASSSLLFCSRPDTEAFSWAHGTFAQQGSGGTQRHSVFAPGSDTEDATVNHTATPSAVARERAWSGIAKNASGGPPPASAAQLLS